MDQNSSNEPKLTPNYPINVFNLVSNTQSGPVSISPIQGEEVMNMDIDETIDSFAQDNYTENTMTPSPETETETEPDSSILAIEEVHSSSMDGHLDREDEIETQEKDKEIGISFPYATSLDCTICSDPIINEQIVKLLPCQHLFHYQCINKWLKEYNNICPICRHRY